MVWGKHVVARECYLQELRGEKHGVPFYYISKSCSLHYSISFVIKAKVTTCHSNFKINKREQK